VLFNEKWISYGKTVDYRVNGPSQSAKYGAIGCLIRSVTPVSISSPHTGATYYDEDLPKIPAAAIALEDADMFDRMYKRGQKIVVNLYMGAYFNGTTSSNNLVGEIQGSKYPEKVILIGGHFDSWDVGSQTGANDDGGGVMVCLEAVNLLLKLGLRPKRTIRFIAWSGEEQGQETSGANQYVQLHKEEMKDHILAFESDIGTTDIEGFGYSGSQSGYDIVKNIGTTFLTPYNAGNTTFGNGGGTDTEPLGQFGVPQMANNVKDTQDKKYYFTYHHSAGDSMNVMDPDTMDRNVIMIAGMMYMIADLPDDLPK